MVGRITSREVCKACGVKGKYHEAPGGGLLCQCGRAAPRFFEVEVNWRRKKLRIIHDQTGRRIDGYLHARRVLEVIRSQLDNGSFDPRAWSAERANRLLWPNYLDDYLAREAVRLLPERRATYARKKALARILRLAFQVSVREIRTGAVLDFFNKPCLRLAYSPKYIADLAAELRYIFGQAVKREDLPKAPQVPSVTVPEAPIAWLTAEDQAAALTRIPEQHRPVFEFLFLYGCRVAEACALCWDRIDRSAGVLALSRTFSRRRLRESTKTNRATVLDLTPELEAILDRLPRGLGASPVFVNPEADRDRNPQGFYLPDFLNSVWKRALAEAGLAPIRLTNASRHSLGMAWTRAGISEAVISRALGHSSSAHTRKYARADVATLAEARAMVKARSNVGHLSAIRPKQRDKRLK